MYNVWTESERSVEFEFQPSGPGIKLDPVVLRFTWMKGSSTVEVQEAAKKRTLCVDFSELSPEFKEKLYDAGYGTDAESRQALNELVREHSDARFSLGALLNIDTLSLPELVSRVHDRILEAS